MKFCKSHSCPFLSIFYKQNIFINSAEGVVTLSIIQLLFLFVLLESKNLFKLGYISAKVCFAGRQCKQIND